MANLQQVALLEEGIPVWNQWRKNHPDEEPDLSGLNLREEDLRGINLSHTNLRGVNLIGADLRGANLIRASLVKADLREANLFRTNLLEADCREAKLNRASLVETNLRGANLTGCSIYGISVWNVQLHGATQSNLIITDSSEPVITVDDLKIAQFIYLLLDNREIRNVINTVTSKVVLILGRFTTKRKVVLDALRNELRKYNYLPVLFDFEKPASKDLTETVSTLAHLARFIIVDLTDPSSAPHELATIIPQCIVPVQPLLLQDHTKSRHEYAMFHDLRRRYDWVLPTHPYQDTKSLLASLKKCVIAPAEQKAKELEKR
jgi:pentapeptide repeat protein